MNSRDHSLDLMRGVAIFMMIAFHLIYDLNEFGYTDIPLSGYWLTTYWRYLIVFLFLSSVGISLVLAYGQQFNIVKFSKRMALLGLAALAVSLGTYRMFPNAWVYFGILHLIWASCLIAVPFVRAPNTSLLIGVVILSLGYFNLPDLSFLRALLSDNLPGASVDFYPLFPWLSLVFIGIYLGHNPWHRKIITFRSTFIQYLGQHSLLIYLVHQVLLFGLVYTIYTLTNL
ncbi:MAG: heparan-alpha-glucosaminide N-acetyltransferase [Gammaproteobacteria bacterium]